MQILGDSVNNELTHSHIIETFMETYGNQVENADKVFGDESHYTAIVKVCVNCVYYVVVGWGELHW